MLVVSVQSGWHRESLFQITVSNHGQAVPSSIMRPVLSAARHLLAAEKSKAKVVPVFDPAAKRCLAADNPRTPVRVRALSSTGAPDCSTAQGGLCHEASIRPVARPNRSSATRAIDNSLGGTSLHRRYAPSGRVAKIKTHGTNLGHW